MEALNFRERVSFALARGKHVLTLDFRETRAARREAFTEFRASLEFLPTNPDRC